MPFFSEPLPSRRSRPRAGTDTRTSGIGVENDSAQLMAFGFDAVMRTTMSWSGLEAKASSTYSTPATV